MEKEKYVFNKEKFSNELYDFIADNDYYEYDTVYDVVHDSLKEQGMESPYIHLVEPLSKCNKNANYLHVNGYKNDLYEYSEINVFNDYINVCYEREMKDPEFAKGVYDYTKENFKYCYDNFVDMRRSCDDAYVDVQEEERER